MDLNDIFTNPTSLKRPDHPDFWTLADISAKLKADMADWQSGTITQEEVQHRWQETYEAFGDMDSIVYHGVQAAFAMHNIKTGEDWARLIMIPARHQSFVQTLQGFFDGFIMGAHLERRHQEVGK